MLNNIIYFIITLLATTVCSLTGMGGGVIIKPIMDVIGDFDVHAISIICSITVFSMALVSIVKHIKSKTKIPFNIALPLAIGSVFGGISGERIFSLFVHFFDADEFIKFIQNIILTILILWVFIYMNNKNKLGSKELKGIFPALIVGLFLGLCSAFLGIGGGPINVTVIVYLFSLPTKTATICSLITILLSQISKLTTVAVTSGFSDLDFSVVTIMITAATIGGFLGAYFNKKLSDKTVEKAFNCIVVVVLVLTVLNIINNLDIEIFKSL